jgi:nicotinamide mononucleotide (NMN) deamidase PncC
MDPAHRLLIESLHRAPGQCVLALTGGGAGAAALLLGVPGASRTVLEVVVPYHEEALAAFLGHRPEQFCSTPTARAMARRAYERAGWLAPGEVVVGLGCTATLATDRPKRGEHRFHVAVCQGNCTTYSLTLHKGARDRAGEEAVVDAVVLNALAESFGVPERVPPGLLAGESLERETHPEGGGLAAFLRGEIAAVCAGPDGQIRAAAASPAALVSGAFNPLHEGHRGLAAAAAAVAGGPIAFELSIINVDKPPLTAQEVRRRLGQFHWQAPVWLTRAPTFAEKADLFPGALFVVGVDTAERIIAPRYYGGSAAALAAALGRIRERGCKFLVGGRADGTGKFQHLGNLALPPAWGDLFLALPEERFRVNVSSTELRGRSAGTQARSASDGTA